jgi:chorismate-pyruvate lyase
MSEARGLGPDLHALYALFPAADDRPEHERVPADAVPQPYHGLLVHEHHMTVTVEAFHGGLVDVNVLATHRSGEVYARKILLVLQKTGRVVQFGIMKINLRYCSEPVRQAILSERIPLGRILIEHNVLRRIEPTAFLRVVPSPAMTRWFGLDRPRPTYGRLAYIHCDGQPAVELLEIVAPEAG